MDKLANLDVINKFLEICKLPKPTETEVENLNKPLTNKRLNQ